MKILKLNTFLKLVGFLFVVKAVFGLLAMLLGWQVVFAGWVIPNWLMVVAVVVDALLASGALSLAKK